MQVRVGIRQSARELEIDIPDQDRQALLDSVKSAMAGSAPFLEVVDKRGKAFIIAKDSLAYVEVDPTAEQRRVGFAP
jgi:hypothetical protein